MTAWESVITSYSIHYTKLYDDFGFDAFPHADVLRHVTEFHHEKLDGSGYPEGLRERDIPLEARIVAVSDVFDALTSKRPYKNAWTNDEALDHLWSLAGVHYDAACLSALDRRLADA